MHMKKTSLLLFSLLFLVNAFSQEEKFNRFYDGKNLFIDSFYADKNQKLILTEVNVFPGISKTKIKDWVKGWAALHMVNMNQTLVAETEDELVLNYIINDFTYKILGMQTEAKWFIRLVVNFKDEKARFSFFDFGNAPMAGTSWTGSIPRGSYYFADYFKNEKEGQIAQKKYLDGLVAVKNRVLKNHSTILKTIQEKKSAQDW